MLHARKCMKCGENKLKPVSREMLVYSSVIHHECEACGAKIDLTPAASIGVIGTVGILALSFWGYILFWHAASPGLIATTLFGLAVVAWGFIVIVPALAHIMNPPIMSVPPIDVKTAGQERHVLRRVIDWIESLGFIAGIIAPVLVIAAVLGVATLIGYVNFTVFGH